MKINISTYCILLGVLVTTLQSCDKTVPLGPEEHELLDGPMEGLTTAQQAQFLRGDEAFGSVMTTEDGLGPIFSSNQCASCHVGDGKGNPFFSITRFGQPDTMGNQFLSMGGPQIQNVSIPGFEPESLPTGATSNNLVAPSVTGLGFLNAVEDSYIISLSDPSDSDGDGISGRPHYNSIPSYVILRENSIPENGKYITRFGKKADAYDLLQQATEAFSLDMGISSLFNPISRYTGLEEDPEISTQTINDVVFYLKTLKAPLRRNIDDPDVIAGEQLFSDLQCAKCHMPTLETGYSPIAQLSNQEFHPYTDMLLHDMGTGLDDGNTEGYALTSEWRTPPLWGLGLAPDSQGGGYFLLHDGRATSIKDAILLHGGEASFIPDAYLSLSDSEKNQLEKFLESL